MSDFEALTLSQEDHLAVITLNRPERLNAFNDKLKKEFATVLRQIGSPNSQTRALLITGAGKGFCAGADLADSSSINTDAGSSLIEGYHPFLLELAELKMPTITAVNGVAAGAGMALALSTDFVVAARSAYFLQAFVNIGLAPDCGSSFILPRLIGEARARSLMMLGEKLPAEKALDWGMIHDVVDDASLMDTATALGTRLAKGPTESYSGIRSLLKASIHNSYAEQLQAEAMVQRHLGRSKDAAEGIQAFLEKRPANFTGK